MPRKPKDGTKIPGEPNSRIMGTSPALLSLLSMARRVAPYSIPVLISGPPGSGKEYLARFLHGQSGRTGQLVTLNCATLSAELAASELFGYVKGAFTGATTAKSGLLEEAHNGTLFLDEVAELHPYVQSMLLRALQGGLVRRIGASRELAVSVRVISATNAPLEEKVRDGKFREDLLWRLSGYLLEVPPLRARAHDALEIALWVIKTSPICTSRNMVLSPTAQRVILEYPWPGNVRELTMFLERLAVENKRQRLDARHLLALLPHWRPWRAIKGGDVAEELLSALVIWGDLTAATLCEQTAFARDVVLETLKRLMSEGHVVRVGVSRGTVYRTTFYEDTLYDIEAVRARDRRRARRKKRVVKDDD